MKAISRKPGKRRPKQPPADAMAPSTNGALPPELVDLIDVSRLIGSQPDLVQGGGGNTSVKTADRQVMYIKASGTALAAMDETRGWAALSLPATKAVLRQGLGELPAPEREARVLQHLQLCVIRPHGARPSVESNLHALLGRAVVHTHPVQLNALLCLKGSEQVYREVVDDEYGEPLYIPYVDPGYTLAAFVDEAIEGYLRRHGRTPAVVLLENHGLFVAADSTADCIRITEAITRKAAAWIGVEAVNPTTFAATVAVAAEAATVAPYSAALLRGALLKGGAEAMVLRRDESEVAQSLLRSKEGLALSRKGAFTPDQIVYCRAEPLVLESRAPEDWHREVARYRERCRLNPRVVIVKPDPRKAAGSVFYAAPDLGLLRVVAETYRSAALVLLQARKAGGPRFLTAGECAFIEDWEVEKFRAALAGGPAAKLQGRIAAVTGAASGLGKAIARGLIKAGATVWALDLNPAALELVQSEMPAGKYLPCQGDVTDEASIAAAFRGVEASLGGLDILINAAGIAPSAPLADFPLGAWKKTLDVNLTGYFLCAREGARLLLRQGAGGSMINLTSKSGLDASKENSAYNATKAGEIHLMRGWALELGRAGIRVNCIAPGNVFKGSQIWNSEYIKACARKKGIKPEEVIPYYTSLSPLGKEIEPEDIANAAVFLVSDEARSITGQTLVVDGGQVMVR